MQSECMAASPQLIWSYAWKAPATRPAIFEHAQKMISRGEEKPGTSQAEHPSIPWKAYLASREFQHLASDLADALFAARPAAGFQASARPASLLSGAKPLSGAGETPLRGMLARALPEGAGAASQEPKQGELPRGLLAAA